MIPTAPESAPRATAPQSAAPQPRFMIRVRAGPDAGPADGADIVRIDVPRGGRFHPPLAAETTPSYASETAPLPASYSAYGGGAAAAANDTAGWGAAPAGGGAYGGGAYGGGAYGAYANDVSTAAYGADHQSSAYGADHQSSAYDFSLRAVPPPRFGPSAGFVGVSKLVRRSRGGGGDVRAYRRWFRRVLGGRFRPRRGRRGHASFAARSSTLCDVLFRFRRSIGRRRSRIPGGADPPAGSTPPGHVRIVRLADAIRESAPRLGDAGVRFLASLDRCRGPIHRNASVRDLAALGEEDDGDGEGDVAGDVAGARGRKRLRTGFRKRLRTGFRDPRYPRDPRTRTRKYSSACSARCANTAARWPARDRARTIRVGPDPTVPARISATYSSARATAPHTHPPRPTPRRTKTPRTPPPRSQSTSDYSSPVVAARRYLWRRRAVCGRTRYCWPRRRGNANSPPSRRRWRARRVARERPAYPRARARGSVARTRGRGRGLHDTTRSHRRRSSRRSSSSLARTRRHLSVERRAGRSRGARRLGRRALDPSRRRLRRARLVRPRRRFADAVSSVGARVFGGRGPPSVSSNVRDARRDSTHGAPRTRRAVGQPATRVGRVSTVQIALRGAFGGVRSREGGAVIRRDDASRGAIARSRIEGVRRGGARRGGGGVGTSPARPPRRTRRRAQIRRQFVIRRVLKNAR